MKRIFLMIALSVLISCNKKQQIHTVKPDKAVIEPENPLNNLAYANKIDYYCKMDITKYGVSDTVRYNGKLYGFCSSVCKEEFLKKPQEYLAKQK